MAESIPRQNAPVPALILGLLTQEWATAESPVFTTDLASAVEQVTRRSDPVHSLNRTGREMLETGLLGTMGPANSSGVK